MLIRFFTLLRAAGIPVSPTEFLALHDALKARLASFSVEEFYVVARAILIKDERFYDRYDRVFSEHLAGIESMIAATGGAGIPAQWLRKLAELTLSEEERRRLSFHTAS